MAPRRLDRSDRVGAQGSSGSRGRLVKGDPYSTLVPDGRYSAAFVGLEKGVVYGQRRWFGYFQITDLGPYHGCTLVRFWNEPRGSFLPHTHNLYKDFVGLIVRRPPSSGLKPEDFLKGDLVRAR